MQGVFTVRSRITGATQFSSASPIVTFNEFNGSVLGAPGTFSLPPSYTARILGFSYNSLGTAHTVLLTLRSPLNVVPNLDDQIVIRSQTGINTFSELCGPDGIVVPRVYGISAQNQQPPLSTVSTAQTYQVFFETTDKDNDGTFILWYRVAEEQQ